MKNKEFYSHAVIINNLLNGMYYRENAFLEMNTDKKPMNVRNIIVNNTSHILSNMNRFFFYKRQYNIYSSVARFDFYKINKQYEFPPFSFCLDKRKEQGTIFNNIHDKYILAYDFVLDFDVINNNFEKTYHEVEIIKNQLDVFEVPYILRFTGSGFHIIIPYKYLPSSNNTIEMCKNIANRIKVLYNLDTIDMVIYNSRRVIKTAYSLDVKTGYVCLPITDKEFTNFSKDICLPDNVVKIKGLYERNTLLRIGDPLGFKKLIKERLGLDVN